jgi:triosephosphate isomerase
MNQRIVLGNWKMNTSQREALELAGELASETMPETVEVGVAPPFPWLSAVGSVLGPSPIRIGAQTSARQTNGAFTGEVSVSMLAELCEFVLIGHSERRALFGETDDVVNEKLLRVVEVGLRPVLCVGETADQRASGDAALTVVAQIDAALRNRDAHELDALVVAYEPVWAIGTGNTATPEDAAEMCSLIRDQVQALISRRVSVLYGGSVNAGNASELIKTGQIDGFLVGGASLKVLDFMTIVRAAAD